MSLKTLRKSAESAARRKGHKLTWGKVTLYKSTRSMQFGTCEHCKHLATIIEEASTPLSLSDTGVMDLGKHLQKPCTSAKR